MNRAHASRASNRPAPTLTHQPGLFSSLGRFFRRRLDDDMLVLGDAWLKDSGVQRQLEFEGYQLRWVTTNKLDPNIADGWQYVLLSHHLWWLRRVRRRHGVQQQYLLKKKRSFRSQNDG